MLKLLQKMVETGMIFSIDINADESVELLLWDKTIAQAKELCDYLKHRFPYCTAEYKFIKEGGWCSLDKSEIIVTIQGVEIEETDIDPKILVVKR